MKKYNNIDTSKNRKEVLNTILQKLEKEIE